MNSSMGGDGGMSVFMTEPPGAAIRQHQAVANAYGGYNTQNMKNSRYQMSSGMRASGF